MVADVESTAALEVSIEPRPRRVLVATLPELGHATPVLNIACELARRGNEVRFASCAFVEPKVAKVLTASGIDFVPLAADVEPADKPDSESHRLKQIGSLTLYIYYNTQMRSSLASAVEDMQPDVILADFMTVCAFEVGDKYRVPVAVNFADTCLLNGVGSSPSRVVTALFSGICVPVAAGEPFHRGPAISRFMWRIAACLYSRVCLVNTYWGMQEPDPMPPNVVLTGPTGQRLAGPVAKISNDELNQWVEQMRQEGRRIVYVTFGSMVVLSATQVRCIYDAVADLPGVAVAWSLKEAAQQHLPERPTHVFVHHWFPQAEFLMLPDVHAVITHCGWGGLMEIMLAGKPVVGVPFFGDQSFNAQLAKARGVGRVVRPRSMTASRLRSAVCKVMEEPSYTACARKMQQSLSSSGGAPAAAAEVEALATHGCEHITRRLPSAVPDLAFGLIGISVLVGAAWLTATLGELLF